MYFRQKHYQTNGSTNSDEDRKTMYVAKKPTDLFDSFIFTEVELKLLKFGP